MEARPAFIVTGNMDVSSLVHLFYNNPTFSDITMVINDEPIYLHKIILAQASTFITLA